MKTKDFRLIQGMLVSAANNQGGSGDIDYNKATNKPSINNIELVGNKTAEALGLTSLDTYTEEVSSLHDDIEALNTMVNIKLVDVAYKKDLAARVTGAYTTNLLLGSSNVQQLSITGNTDKSITIETVNGPEKPIKINTLSIYNEISSNNAIIEGDCSAITIKDKPIWLTNGEKALILSCDVEGNLTINGKKVLTEQ